MNKTIIVLTIFLSACVSIADKEYIEVNNKYLESNIPKYISYIHNDTTMDDLEKQAFKASAEEIVKINRERLAIANEKKE